MWELSNKSSNQQRFQINPLERPQRSIKKTFIQSTLETAIVENVIQTEESEFSYTAYVLMNFADYGLKFIADTFP